MIEATPLPQYLVQRYHGWRATAFVENCAWYRWLAEDGQRPRAMVIACCDLRVHVTSIFGADWASSSFTATSPIWCGPCPPTANSTAPRRGRICGQHAEGRASGGHGPPNGGGVQGCHAMCSGHAPELEERTSFVGRWMDILRPGYEQVVTLPAGGPAIRGAGAGRRW